MFDAEQYLKEYRQLEHGAPRLRALKKAIQAADEAGNAEWGFRFRDRCMHDSIFDSDIVDAMVTFPEMIRLYDSSEELQADDEYRDKLMWGFKWIIGNASDFTHITLEQINGFMEEFKSRLERYGYSMRPYYYLREKLSAETKRMLPEPEYQAYRKEPEDTLKDCKACEASHDVNIQLLFDHRAEAEKLSEPLFSGELHCAEIPQNTYANWIDFDIRTGDYGHARKLAKRLYPMVRYETAMLREIGSLMHLYAHLDRQIGTTVFRQNLSKYMDSRNHYQRFRFAAGAYRLFKEIRQEHFNLILPQEFPLYNDEHRYESAVLRDYFYEEAKTLAEKFDARNGNSGFMDFLNAEDPAYDEQAVDLIHGDAEQTPSVIGAACTVLPDELTKESVIRSIEQDARYKVVMSHADEQGVLAFQITEVGSGDIYQMMVACQPVPEVEGFRPATPISDDVPDAVKNCEGVVLFVMPFEEKQPDLALHFQLRMIHLICPAAVAYLDYSRRKLLPAGWVALAAESDVPPLVDYLYNLQLHGSADSEYLWIRTQGLNCCGIRDLEILDATKENYPRYCDMLCFTVERILLRGEMTDARAPFRVMNRSDNTAVVCTWVPVSEAAADYPESDAAGMKLRMQLLEGDSAADYESDAILYLYDGETPEGEPKRKRLSTITEQEFEQFRYGTFIVTARKTAALAKERYGILRQMFEHMPDTTYVCVSYESGEDEDDVWIKVESAGEQLIKGTLADDCLAGAAGTPFETAPDRLTDFSVRVNDQLMIHPNTAYIALDLDA